MYEITVFRHWTTGMNSKQIYDLWREKEIRQIKTMSVPVFCSSGTYWTLALVLIVIEQKGQCSKIWRGWSNWNLQGKNTTKSELIQKSSEIQYRRILWYPVFIMTLLSDVNMMNLEKEIKRINTSHVHSFQNTDVGSTSRNDISLV